MFVGHLELVNRCAVSPDGTLLSTASDDGTLRLWNISDGACEAVLRGRTSWVDSCTFAPTGNGDSVVKAR